MLSTLFSLLITSLIIGQKHGHDKGEMSDRLKAKKIAYIVESLELTPEESQKFWPVYNAFRDEMKALSFDRKKSMDMTEEEAKSYLTEKLDRDRQEIEIKEKYHVKYLEIISARKLVKLIHVERKFKRDMLNDIKRKYSSRRHRN